MEKFFYPKSIAVAGVSPEENKNSNVIISNLIEMGYQGKIFGIGKQHGDIFGNPIYLSIEEIKEPIDLLVVMVPAFDVPAMLEEAGKAGIDRAVIITGGFNELGGDGDSLALEIERIADKYSIRFIGPNCQGIICADSGVCVPFAPVTTDQVKNGGIALIAQSGSVGWSGSFILTREIDGISKIASLGNKLNVSENELVEYLIEDPKTRIIVLYLESFSNGRKLCEIAGRSTKPIIILKSNTSGKESKLAFSHTAALASDNRIVDGALAQAGILRAGSISKMINMCKAMALPIIKGKNLVVLAASGGMGIIGEDAALREGLRLADLPTDILHEIASKGNWQLFDITNPIDIGGFFNNAHIVDSIDRILSLEEVDGVIFSAFSNGPYCYPYDSLQLTDQVENLSKKHSKPVAMDFVADLDTIVRTKKEKDYPIFDTIEDAAWALSTQWKYRKILNKKHSPYMNLNARKKKVGDILSGGANDFKAMKIAEAYGIRCEMPIMAANLDDARLKTNGMGYPLVMKINSPNISHKTDVGGVVLNIKNETELETAYREIMDNVKRQAGPPIQGVMLQKMIPHGMELIIGGKLDNDFGPVIMFGMGGIFVEALEDVAFRMAPICREEAYDMIEQSKTNALLKGIRGNKPHDISALAEALERFSILLADFPEIAELDLNPVILFSEGEGLVAVDGRIKTR